MKDKNSLGTIDDFILFMKNYRGGKKQKAFNGE